VRPMAMPGQLVGDEAAAITTGPNLLRRAASAARWFGEWMEAYAEYRGSAALYEELRRLSDDELRKRGLTRETLARYAFGLRD
jgi:hypothetical protein